jgi:hypothetical protein
MKGRIYFTRNASVVDIASESPVIHEIARDRAVGLEVP